MIQKLPSSYRPRLCLQAIPICDSFFRQRKVLTRKRFNQRYLRSCSIKRILNKHNVSHATGQDSMPIPYTFLLTFFSLRFTLKIILPSSFWFSKRIFLRYLLAKIPYTFPVSPQSYQHAQPPSSEIQSIFLISFILFQNTHLNTLFSGTSHPPNQLTTFLHTGKI